MSSETRTDRPRVPTVMLIVAGVAVAAAAVMAVVGAYMIGITWDERTNMLSLQEFFDQGWNITEDALINGQPNPAYIWGIYVYGPVSLLFTHLLSSIAGAETWGQVSFDAQAYAIRHVGGALIGVAGIVAAGLTVRFVTRSWRWALLGAAMLAVVPLWIGHSMMNIKDGPVATGYTVATLGLVLLLRDDYLSRWSVRASALVALFLGAFLATGTRAASGAPVAASVVVCCVAWWLFARRDPVTPVPGAMRGALRRLLEGALAMVAAYGAMLLLYPNAFKDPFVLAYQAVIVSAKFPFNEPIMFAGSWVGQPVPWTYLPGWFAAQLPLLVLLAAVGFAVFWAVQAVRLVLARTANPSREVIAMSTAVVLQAVAVPAAGIVGHATMYNAERQFLFVVPAAAILATLGIWIVVRRLTAPSRRAWATVAWIVVAVGMTVPLVSQARLFPYNYTYFNAAASLAPIDGTWSTDYWRASSNEIMRRLPADGPESCAYEQSRKGELSPCSDEPMFQPYVAERGVDAKPGTLGPGQYWVVRENQGQTTIPQGCTLHDEITRPLFWQTITIAQIMACDADAVIPANGDVQQ